MPEYYGLVMRHPRANARIRGMPRKRVYWDEMLERIVTAWDWPEWRGISPIADFTIVLDGEDET